jgi:hypothetical protein
MEAQNNTLGYCSCSSQTLALDRCVVPLGKRRLYTMDRTLGDTQRPSALDG